MMIAWSPGVLTEQLNKPDWYDAILLHMTTGILQCERV